MGTQTSRAPGGLLILAGALLVHFIVVTVVPGRLLPAVSLAVAGALLVGGLAARRTSATSPTATGLLASALLVAGLALAGGAFTWWSWITGWGEVVHALLWLGFSALAWADRNTTLLALITAELVFVQPSFALHGATYGYLTLALAVVVLLGSWRRSLLPARITAAVSLTLMALAASLNGLISAGPAPGLHALVCFLLAAALGVGEARFPAGDSGAARLLLGAILPVVLVIAGLATLAF